MLFCFYEDHHRPTWCNEWLPKDTPAPDPAQARVAELEAELERLKRVAQEQQDFSRVMRFCAEGAREEIADRDRRWSAVVRRMWRERGDHRQHLDQMCIEYGEVSRDLSDLRAAATEYLRCHIYCCEESPDGCPECAPLVESERRLREMLGMEERG